MIATRLTRTASTRLGHRRTAATLSLSWSGDYTFASPESDFYQMTPKQEHHNIPVEWSHTLSFASPDSDFMFHSIDESFKEQPAEWSNTLSFASPESDFAHVETTPQSESTEHQHWSNSLSFASPEADFTSHSNNDDDVNDEWSHELSFTSAESDFTFTNNHTESSTKEDFVHHVPQDSHWRNSMATSLSFSSFETDFMSTPIMELLDQRTKKQLQNNIAEFQKLPSTLQQVIMEEETTTKHAIVVTKPFAPFEIVHVNDAWVELCGYTSSESLGSTLSTLIQGPETDIKATNILLEQLLHGQEASMQVINYNKGGKKFINHVRAKPLISPQNEITHFVGILQSV